MPGRKVVDGVGVVVAVGAEVGLVAVVTFFELLLLVLV